MSVRPTAKCVRGGSRCHPCDSLDGEPESKCGPEPADHPGPEDAELERKDGAGHGSDRELDGHHDRPSPRDLQGNSIPSEYADALHEGRVERQRNTERHQDVVIRQRERHLDAAGK